LDATFFAGRDCTSEQGQDSLAQPWPSGGGWQQVRGVLHAPTYTQSALFSVSISGCDALCSLAGNFDDIDVADAADTAPTITGFTPTSGWPGATRVWIYGFDFVGATSVTFNGAEAQFNVGSDGFIDAYVPTGATTGPISVTTANGTGRSSTPFTIVPPPRITSFTPTTGLFGTVVDIRGSNFTGAIWVQFNSRYAEFTLDSDSEIHTTVPDGTTTGPISVTTSSGTGSSTSSFTVPTPTISSFTPTSGPFGTRVDILGTNFSWATIVTFHGTRAEFTIDSDSEIHATVPTGASTGWISVAGTSGSAMSASSFAVDGGAPAITSITPMSGPAGTSVDIRGSNLTGATSVTFGNNAATFTVDSDSELHTTVPSGATNSYITVVTPVGSITAGSLFLVNASPPTISSFTPASGAIGTTVRILGWSLADATSVKFNGANAAYTVDSDSEIHAIVPDSATTGRIEVTAPLGTATSSSSFTVSRVNAPPIARFAYSCTALTCSLDAGASTDSDGTIVAYSWSFADGTGGNGRTVDHNYAVAAGYVVTLTVTDDAGATATDSQTITLIGLTARGHKTKGLQAVDLTWGVPSGASFDVYRDDGKIATVQATAYTDNLNLKGSATHTYRVCAPAKSTCSNDAKVSF
jgi:hypothetical protein